MAAFTRLIYTSYAVERMGDEALEAMVHSAAMANMQRDVSGMLVYDGTEFMQVLEGDPVEVAALYARIAQDPRHRAVEMLDTSTVAERRFAQWGMNLLHPAQFDQAPSWAPTPGLLSHDFRSYDAMAALSLLEAAAHFSMLDACQSPAMAASVPGIIASSAQLH